MDMLAGMGGAAGASAGAGAGGAGAGLAGMGASPTAGGIPGVLGGMPNISGDLSVMDPSFSGFLKTEGLGQAGPSTGGMSPSTASRFQAVSKALGSAPRDQNPARANAQQALSRPTGMPMNSLDNLVRILEARRMQRQAGSSQRRPFYLPD